MYRFRTRYTTRTRNSVGWQFSGSKHDVTKVESGVVDAAQLLVRMLGWIEIFERRLDPLETGQVTGGQHVDEGFIRLYQMLLVC